MLELLQINIKREILDEKERIVYIEKERKIRECQQSVGLKVKRVLDKARVTYPPFSINVGGYMIEKHI